MDQWTIPLLNWVFIFAKKEKSFTTAGGSILKLVQLPSLAARCFEMRKIYACRVWKICIFLYYARKSLTTKWPKFTGSGKAFPRVMLKYTKFANFARVYFSCFTTFRRQTGQFSWFWDVLSSCGEIFCFFLQI
mgnify:CR=1 FL=1